MEDKKKPKSQAQIDRIDRVMRYADLIQKQTGKAIRPFRADGYVNLVNRYGTSKDTSEHYQFDPEPAVPDDVLSMFYEGNGLFSKIIDTPAEEAVKHGFTLANVTDQTVLDFCYSALDELDWEETAMTAIKWARLFGGSIAVMLINDGRGIDEPLDWSNIRSIDDIRIYDRSVITPDYSSMFSYDPQDPFRTRGSRLGMPEYYTVFSRYGSFTVHDSRCLVFKNGVLPENCTNSIYQLWGMPEYVRIHRAIRDAELAHASGPKMLDKSVQAIYKMKNLAMELATEEGEDRVLKRLHVIDAARGMLNSIAIDAEGEDYDFKSFQLAGVADVMDAACNYLSALSSIPQTILFGRSPAGMNATGESDFENFYNFTERIQKRMLRSNLRYLLSVIFQAGVATGEISEVPKININFNPLWSMSDNEQADLDQKKAQVQQTKAQTAQIYVDMGAIDPTEVRKKLADSEEFDVENMLDDMEDDEDLFEEMAGQIRNQENETDEPLEIKTENGLIEEGNSPDSAPAATKLPQDMTDEELAESDHIHKNEDNAEDIHLPSDEGNSFSVGVIVVSDGRILTGKRHNDFGYGLICGPGGHIEKGETAKQAAFRETEEEFGISPKELIPLGFGPAEPETGLTPVIYLCTEYDGEPDCVDLEIANPQFRTLEEIEQMNASLFPPFKDSIELLKSIIKEEKATHKDGLKATADGGPGSGNFGHEGVRGKVGGSAPAGSNVGGEEHKPISERSKPAVKSPANFESYIQEHGLTPIYRGYSAGSEEQLEEYKESYKTGTAPESGERTSGLGKGVYFATSQSEAEGYMKRRQGEKGETEGRVTTAALDVGAKVYDYNEMRKKKLEDESAALQEARKAKEAGDTEGCKKLREAYYDLCDMSFDDYVRNQGADAIIEPAFGYIVVINQNALVVRDDTIDETPKHSTFSVISENPIDLSAKTSIIKSKNTTDDIVKDGGSGSGNFGHSGVPGKTGGSTPTASARGENKKCKGFANAKREKAHIDKHLKEYPEMDANDYVKHAQEFLAQPCSDTVDGYVTKKGEVVRFDRTTGEFAKGVPGGKLMTCYKAKYSESTGKVNLELANKYFDQLKKAEGVAEDGE